jgi:hypothetical protein
VLTIAAMAISIAGGINIKFTDMNTHSTLRRVGAVMFAIVYVLLVIVHIASWSYRYVIMRHRMPV